MKNIVETLMERDQISREEAESQVDEVREMIILNPMEAVEIMMDELYLEPDYIEQLF